MMPPTPTDDTSRPELARTAALPWVLRRGRDDIGITEIRSTKEQIHGLLRLFGDHVVVQWRLARETTRVGWDVKIDKEIEPVHEVTIPLAGIAGARVRRRWFQWPPGGVIVLTAADLRAFEGLAGPDGLKLDHPAELALTVRRADIGLAQEFAAELEIALAERALAIAESARRLPPAQAERVQPPRSEESPRLPR